MLLAGTPPIAQMHCWRGSRNGLPEPGAGRSGIGCAIPTAPPSWPAFPGHRECMTGGPRLGRFRPRDPMAGRRRGPSLCSKGLRGLGRCRQFQSSVDGARQLRTSVSGPLSGNEQAPPLAPTLVLKESAGEAGLLALAAAAFVAGRVGWRHAEGAIQVCGRPVLVGIPALWPCIALKAEREASCRWQARWAGRLLRRHWPHTRATAARRPAHCLRGVRRAAESEAVQAGVGSGHHARRHAVALAIVLRAEPASAKVDLLVSSGPQKVQCQGRREGRPARRTLLI